MFGAGPGLGVLMFAQRAAGSLEGHLRWMDWTGRGRMTPGPRGDWDVTQGGVYWTVPSGC
jgi:hypothetical protein